MITPPPLRPGSKIRVVAPSGPFDRETFEAGRQWLEHRYEVVTEPTLFDREGFLAGSDERRLEEMRTALHDPQCAAIVAARGGYGATRVSSALDFSVLRRSPKWLVGFSDFTALHAMAWSQGVTSLHAANVTSLGSNPMLRGAWSQALEAKGEARRFAGLNPLTRGRAEGFLVGGNLTVLAAMVGTAGFVLPDPCILFLEDVGEAPYRLDRALNTLWRAGVLDRVAGCALGAFVNSTPGPYGISAERAVEAFLLGLRVPILAGLPIGHGEHIEPLRLGQWTTLDCATRTLTTGSLRPS